MSSIIRQQLTPLLQTVLKATSDTQALLNLPDEGNSLDALGVAAENLSQKTNQIKELLQEWTSILASPEREIREEENALFSQFLVLKQAPGEILIAGLDARTKLDIKVDRIRSQLPPAPPPLGGTCGATVRPNVKLPALQLPDFDGQDSNWPSFWAAFEQAIHGNPSLAGSQKLTYLVGRLRGAARTLVDGFGLTDDNYQIVVSLLKGRFGDESKRADRLRSELFHLPKPTGHSNSLRSFSEQVDRICRQLEGLGTNLDDNPFLTVAIKEKLPTDVKTQLYDKEMEGGVTWTSRQWRERLAAVVRLKEAVHAPWELTPNQTPPPTSKSTPRISEPIKRAFPVVSENKKATPVGCCSLCLAEGHRPSKCPTYRTADQRRNRLQEQGRCRRCAREGHSEPVCPSTATCFRCNGHHHVLVCPQIDQKGIGRGSNAVPLGQRPPSGVVSSVTQPQAASITSPPLIPQVTSIVTSPPPSKQRPSAYLMIREIAVFNNCAPNPVQVPVFFDPGSQPSFISTDLISTIRPTMVAEENMTVGGFSGNSSPHILQFPSPRFAIRLQRKDGGWETVELNQTPKIVPPVEFLKEINWQLAEKMGVVVKEPKILLGIREFWRFVQGRKEISPGLFRISTVFGDNFGGESDRFSPEVGCPLPLCSPIICSAVVRAQPDQLVQNLWSMDSIGIRDPIDKDDDELAITTFRDTVRFTEGRYEVGWPWRPEGRDRLPTNFSLAYSRLSSLSHRLLNNPELREKYQSVINEQLQREIIEPVSRTGALEHFIPHQAVITPKKVRVVYDASAHEKGKPSLNELLLPGPNWVPELTGILLRFRGSTFPVLGDIEKAFLAVSLREEDREVAKFLWLKDPSRPLTPENLAIFRFRRIAFGINSSPFLLAAVLQHHLASTGDSLRLSRNFYVDNLLICSESAVEAAESLQLARQQMASAGMRLREFVAADRSILAGLPPEDVLVGEVQKVLGLIWDLDKEVIVFHFPPPGGSQ